MRVLFEAPIQHPKRLLGVDLVQLSPLGHLYRLESQSEIIGAGLEHHLTMPDGLAAVEWFERWLGGGWQPGQPLPESAKPADGQVLRLAHLADEGETKRKIVHEDFGD